MAKKAGRPATGRDDASCRINRVLLSRAKLVASHRGIPVAQLLSELVDLPLDRAYLQMLKDMESRSKKGGA